MNINLYSNSFLFISNHNIESKFNIKSTFADTSKRNDFLINSYLNSNSNSSLNQIIPIDSNQHLKYNTTLSNDIITYTSKNSLDDNKKSIDSFDEDINTVFNNKTLINSVFNVLNNIGFHELNQYQKALFDELSKGNDVIIHSYTSSGKTFGVLLFLVLRYYYQINPQILKSNTFTHLIKNLNNRNPNDINNDNIKNNYFKYRVLILCPTRELSVQSSKQILTFLNNNVDSVHLIIDDNSDISEISDDIVFIVGSSNDVERLLLKSKTKALRSILQSIEFVFLDEIDRLLKVPNQYANPNKKQTLYNNPGSAYNICQSILNVCPNSVRIVCSSASITRGHIRKIDRLLKIYRKGITKRTAIIRNKISATDTGRYVTIPDTVKHYYTISIDNSIDSKVNKLIELLKNERSKSIIFVNNGSLISIKNQLINNHIKCDILHNELGIKDDINSVVEDKNLFKKLDVYNMIEQFQNKMNDLNDKSVIIASTDSSRGIHIPTLKTVYILGRPRNVNEYIHISGRVGRCCRIGRCITIDSKENIRILMSWQKKLNIIIQRMTEQNQCI